MAADLALARRAVACPGFRWMPGMRIESGLRLIYLIDCTEDGEEWMVCPEDVGMEAFAHDPVFNGDLPDFDDDATLGALLGLVREAWRPTCPTPFTLDCSPELGDDSPWTLLICGDRSRTWAGPLAECLVAALEAAPVKP